MLFDFLFRKKTLFIELGNLMSKASVIEHSRRKYTVIDVAEVVNPFFKNGIIKNKNSFAECISTLVKKLHKQTWSSIIVGLDSSYIIYSGFETNTNEMDKILSRISSLVPDNKVIYHVYNQNKVSVLSIQRNLLDKIYSCLEHVSIRVNKFVPTKYFHASHISKAQEKKDILMVINLGYRSSNISVFQAGFLVSYKTVLIGVENLILAIASKCEVSADDALLIIKEISLFESDEREWVLYSDKNFKKKQIADLLNLYTRALARKIIGQDYNYVSDVILTGWANHIEGIVKVFEEFLPNVTLCRENNELYFIDSLV